ncbi:MAG: phosphoribosylformimino-5-aminoimidazole carboxamide ribotide isomerase [Lachnospiraceae bacterium]|nr:phosphoribosylformimino-5-aminoimidazole carboxamide ribotide isomerase [Lachnospiraceae bacterium]
MKFRPCIDIHNGRVKQIVGSSLKDAGNTASENFVAEQGAVYFADLYKSCNLTGGHIVLLNAANSEYYDATRVQAMEALKAYPGGMQIGGGINPENAAAYLEAGASHVIVTSYVFQNGKIHYDRLKQIEKAVGKERLVLDLSCRKKGNHYYVVTERWQNFTDVTVDKKILDELSEHCDEFLVHAVDVEGKAAGIERELAELLGDWNGIPVTYAGGISSMEDIRILHGCSGGTLDYTIGSALDLFGGTIPFRSLAVIRDWENIQNTQDFHNSSKSDI